MSPASRRENMSSSNAADEPQVAQGTLEAAQRYIQRGLAVIPVHEVVRA